MWLFPVVLGIAEIPLSDSYKKYHRQSLMILRKFGFGNSNVMEIRINREVEDLVNELQKFNSKPLYPKSLVNGSVFNVIASILFGRRFERSDPRLDNWITCTNSFVAKLLEGIKINFFPWLRFIPTFKRFLVDLTAHSDALLNILEEKIDEVLSQEDDKVEASFIRSFIDENGRDQFDRNELLFILRDLVLAGAETSTTTILWAVALLADHPDVQRRMHEEIDSVLVDRHGRQLASLADRTRLPYVEATILELMRFKTIVPLSVPRETVQDSVVEGYTIPAQTMVNLQNY